VWAEARETKDELVDKTKVAAKDGAQRFLTELKERAAANPVAALAIGAGLAWRLVHRPPVATLLVGMGVVGLLRTSPARSAHPYMGLYDEDPRLRRSDAGLAARAGDLAEVVKEKVQDWSANAGDVARSAASQVAETASAVSERAAQVLHDARDTVTRMGDNAASMTERASDDLQDANDAARQTVAQMGAKTASVARQASQSLQDAGGAAREAVAEMADKASSLAQQASTRVYNALPDREDRDTYLLGAAALAVAAAVGIAYQRRAHQDDVGSR
jgi:ElaB/YqjD/DUF883 family membrane-anchored ribosome-binding protein